MSPIDWAKRPLQKYADFTGRAPRPEYWWFYLLVVIAYVVAMIIDSVIGTGGALGPYGMVMMLTMLGLLIPSIAAAVRRLHDTDHSGWWLLIAFIPLIGAIVLLVFWVSAGTPGPNQYGEDPYGKA